MKTKAYCLITAFLVGFAVWFGTYQHYAHLRAENEALTQKVFALHTENAKLEKLKPYHNWRKIWLARALVSETDRTEEMPYLATVIRNRVETCYRSRCTFKGVILDPKQFSAFNKAAPRRDLYMRLDDKIAYENGIMRWSKAKTVADSIIKADRSELPLPKDVLYFWSPISMPHYKPRPLWASKRPEHEVESVPTNRFKFHKQSR